MFYTTYIGHDITITVGVLETPRKEKYDGAGNLRELSQGRI